MCSLGCRRQCAARVFFTAALGLAATYALGCGAILFAGEQEAETYEFQRALPVDAKQVFAGKIAFALASAAALFGLNWFLAWTVSGWRLPSAAEHAESWAILGFFGLEMFLWAALFSLVLRRVLVAAILGVAAASVGANLVTRYVVGLGFMEMYAQSLPWRAALAASVALLDVWLGARWFISRADDGGASLRTIAGYVIKTFAVLGLMYLGIALIGLRLGNANFSPWWLLFFCLEALLWAALFALLWRRAFRGALLGILVAWIIDEGMVELAMPLILPKSASPYLASIFWRVVLATLLAAADGWLAVKRFREWRDGRWRAISPSSVTNGSILARAGRPDRMAIFWRLAWQDWRQSMATMATVGGAIIFLAIVPAGWLVVERFRNLSNELISKPLYVAAMALLPLLGTCVFLADQRRGSFRFLADRGVPPKYVWLSRLLVAIVPLMVTLPVLLVFAYLLAPSYYVNESQNFIYYWGVSLALAFACVVVGFTAGQLCSMFFRSAILAGLFSIILGLVLSAWCGLMLLWGINWLWSVLPIPLALLLATRLRAADWLAQRNSLRAWLRPALVLAVPAVAILTAVPFVRVHSVPEVDPGFSPTEYARTSAADQHAAVDIYERALQGLTHRPAWTAEEKEAKKKDPFALTAGEKSWVNDNQGVIATLLKISHEKLSYRWGQDHLYPLRDQFYRLPELLEYSAIKLEEEGNLDGALEQYLAVLRISAHFRDPSNWYSRSREEQSVYTRVLRLGRPARANARTDC